MFSTKIVNAQFKFSSRRISFQYFRYYYPNISLTINLNKENNNKRRTLTIEIGQGE